MTETARLNFPAGTVHEIAGDPHKYLGETIPGRIHLMSKEGAPFVVPDGKGGMEMPTPDQYDQLVLDKVMKVITPPLTDAVRQLAATAEWDHSDCLSLDTQCTKMQFEMLLLDKNGVKNGIKAITAGLAKHYTAEHRAEWGGPSMPEKLKRWRSERGTLNDRPLNQCIRMTGRTPSANILEDVVEEVRQKHALGAASAKGTMMTAYAAAVAEIADVNAGLSRHYTKPEKPYVMCHYTTFWRSVVALQGSETVESSDGKLMVEARMRGGGAPLTASRALEKVIIDHTELDAFFVIDPEREMGCGRPWLTLAIDVATRAVLAWVITFWPPSY